MKRYLWTVLLAAFFLLAGGLALLYLCLGLGNKSSVLERDGGLWYQGVPYREERTFEAVKVYREDEYAGSSRDGFVSYYTVEGDEAHEFLSGHQWDGKILYAREDARVPTEGRATAVYAEGGPDFWQVIEGEAGIATLLSLNEAKGKRISVPVSPQDGPFKASAGLYVCYEGCPVAGGWVGELYRTMDAWIFVSREALEAAWQAEEEYGEYYEGIVLDRDLQAELERLLPGLGV